MDCKSCHANGQMAASDMHVQALGLMLSSSQNRRPAIPGEHPASARHPLPDPALEESSGPVRLVPLLEGARPGGQGAGRGRRSDATYLSEAMHRRHGRTFDNQLPTAERSGDHLRAGGRSLLQVPSGQPDELPAQCHGRGGGRLSELPWRSARGRRASIRWLSGKIRDPWTDLPKCQSCHTGDFVKPPPAATCRG